MAAAIAYIQALLSVNGMDINLSINPYLVAGGMGMAPTNAAAPNSPAGAPGGFGQPDGFGQPGGPLGGMPPLGGGVQDPFAALFGGQAGAGPTPNPGAFNPRQVKLRGFTLPLRDISALRLLQRVELGFDHPKGIQFLIEPSLGGVLFVERANMNADPRTGAPLFTQIFYVNPNIFSQGLTNRPPAVNGHFPGGGMMGGGMMGGGMMGGGMMGGGMMGGGGGDDFNEESAKPNETPEEKDARKKRNEVGRKQFDENKGLKERLEKLEKEGKK